jgi:hypothetical protein
VRPAKVDLRAVLVTIAAVLCLLGALSANGSLAATVNPLVFIGVGLTVFMTAEL